MYRDEPLPRTLTGDHFRDRLLQSQIITICIVHIVDGNTAIAVHSQQTMDELRCQRCSLKFSEYREYLQLSGYYNTERNIEKFMHGPLEVEEAIRIGLDKSGWPPIISIILLAPGTNLTLADQIWRIEESSEVLQDLI